MVTHDNDISDKEIVSDEEGKAKEKTISFGGSLFETNYRGTLYYPIGDLKLDQYVVRNSNSEETRILLLPDGSIYSMLGGNIVTIPGITKTSLPEEARKAAEEALGTTLDFSQYQHFDCTASAPLDTSGRFGLYLLTWYNEENGIVFDDALSLCVDEKGIVSALWVKGNAKQSFGEADALDPVDVYHDDIEDKLKGIYDTENCKFVDYSIMNSTYVIYKGSTCILCTVSIHVEDTDGNIWGEARRLLVQPS